MALFTSIPSNSRIIYEIERIARQGASMSRIEYDNGEVEWYKLEIQEILGTLNEALGVGEHATDSAPIDPHHPATAPVSDSGTPLAHLRQHCMGRSSFLVSQLRHSSLWAFDQARLFPPRTPLPNRNGLLE